MKSFKQNYSVAGMVVSSIASNYKNGKPYRKVKLSDSEDEANFFVKGEVLEKNPHLFEEEKMVIYHLKPGFYIRKDGTESFSWTVVGGELLDYVLEKKVTRIKIFMPKHAIDAGFINEFKQLVSQNRDNSKNLNVEFSVKDAETNVDVTLSGVFKVDISAFCHQLVEQFPDFNIQLA